MSTPTPVIMMSDEQVISKYVEYLTVAIKFPKSNEVFKLRTYIQSIFNSNPTYYTKNKGNEIHNKSYAIYQMNEILLVLKRLYFGYLKYDYLSSVSTNNFEVQTYKSLATNALNEYNSYKLRTKITEDSSVKNDAKIDLLVFIQREINNYKKRNTTNELRKNKLTKLSDKQKIDNDIKRDTDLLKTIQTLLNNKLIENASVSKIDIENKANSTSYIIQENYDEKCIGVC